jgi:hypothetical protein
MGDTELARMRRKVDRGEPLILDLEAGALIREMMRATAAVKPAATTLNRAVQRTQAEAGHELSYDEIQALWNTPGLHAVKLLHDRERARWRRANGILTESNLLLRGEARAASNEDPTPVAPDPARDAHAPASHPPRRTGNRPAGAAAPRRSLLGRMRRA